VGVGVVVWGFGVGVWGPPPQPPIPNPQSPIPNPQYYYNIFCFNNIKMNSNNKNN